MNGSSCFSLTNPTAEKIGKTIACCLILVVSLVGNSFIALTVYKTQTLRKPINYFIVNMAMSDMLYPIFRFPVKLSWLYMDSWLISGPLGQALCKLVFFLSHTSFLVSIQSLVLIAVDRFGAVVFPFRSPLIGSKLCSFCILATWIVAMAVFSPYSFAFKLVKNQAGQRQCLHQANEVFGDSSSLTNYVLSVNVVFFYIPIAFLIILYSIIVIKLKLQRSPGEQSVNAAKKRAKRNRNVLKMAIAVVLVFILCWVPRTVIAALINSAPARLSCEVVLYWDIAWFMSVSNCAINPFICCIFSGNYRQGLKKFLKCVG